MCIHPECESLTSIWADQNGWTYFQNVGHSLVFKQIRTTDENGWTHVQDVSCSPVFVQIRTKAKHVSRMSVPLQCLSRSEPLIRVVEHTSSLWVTCTLQCLSRTSTDENGWTFVQFVSCLPLFEHMRMAEHASSQWVALQYMYESEPLTRMVNIVLRM